MRVALAHAARDGRSVAVILADVDAMKDINDSFGHAVGDDVLRRVARAMSRGVRTGDTVARLGGDEFVVLVDGLDETDTAWQVAERLRDAVCRAPVEPGAERFVVTASFGLAIATPDDAPAELLQRADAAMYRAKAMGGAKVVVFEDGADVSITTLADELAVAVSHGLIRPHVQSVVDLDTGSARRIPGPRALGTSPARAARRRSSSSTSWRTRRSCRSSTSRCSGGLQRAAARTARNGLRVRAYGHLSRRLIGDVDLERYLTEIVDDLGIAPSDLCVEIAHSLVARPSRTVESTLRTICARSGSDRAQRGRRRMRGQRDRRVRVRRAPARARASSATPAATRPAGASRTEPSRSPARSVSP